MRVVGLFAYNMVMFGLGRKSLIFAIKQDKIYDVGLCEDSENARDVGRYRWCVECAKNGYLR